MAELGPESIEHVARIARLALTPEERERFAAEARSILAHFEEVSAALREPEPAAEVGTVEPRPDEPVQPEPAQVEAMVGEFPRKEQRLCRVPGGL